jgi:hypothetical protein
MRLIGMLALGLTAAFSLSGCVMTHMARLPEPVGGPYDRTRSDQLIPGRNNGWPSQAGQEVEGRRGYSDDPYLRRGEFTRWVAEGEQNARREVEDRRSGRKDEPTGPGDVFENGPSGR